VPSVFESTLVSSSGQFDEEECAGEGPSRSDYSSLAHYRMALGSSVLEPHRGDLKGWMFQMPIGCVLISLCEGQGLRVPEHSSNEG
jgi:hypothetical protein